MKKQITLSRSQAIGVAIVILAAACLLAKHLIKPEYDGTQTSLFILSFIVPILFPPALFNKHIGNSGPIGFLSTILIAVYSYFMTWLGRSTVFGFVFMDFSMEHAFRTIFLPILAGMFLFFILYSLFNYKEDQKILSEKLKELKAEES